MNTGSNYFNYKNQFSVVLMALVDGNYNFLFAEVGCQGRISDGGVFKDTKLYTMITQNTLGLPPPKELPGREMIVPYFFAADSAFSLCERVMKPYSGAYPRGSSQRIFNYRLSRGRRVVENAFGILSAIFRVLRKPILLEPSTVELVVMATIYLHNFLRKHSPTIYMPPGSMDSEENGVLCQGSWRNDQDTISMLPLRNIHRRPPAYANSIREELSDYFMKEGAIPWQNAYA